MGLTICASELYSSGEQNAAFLYIILRLTYSRGLIHRIGQGVPNAVNLWQCSPVTRITYPLISVAVPVIYPPGLSGTVNLWQCSPVTQITYPLIFVVVPMIYPSGLPGIANLWQCSPITRITYPLISVAVPMIYPPGLSGTANLWQCSPVTQIAGSQVEVFPMVDNVCLMRIRNFSSEKMFQP